jgi:hypothetical protein
LDPIVFTCGVCGKEHTALPPIVPDFTPEQVEERKQAWLQADEKLSKYPGNEHYEKDYYKAWFAYGATMSNGVARLPDTITTSKKAGQHIFRCLEHETEQEGQQGQRPSQQRGSRDDSCGCG